MKLSPPKKMLSAAAAASVLLLTAACGGGDDPADSETSSSAAPSDDAGDEPEADGTYEDGDYDASGSYDRPSGTSEVDVSLTIADGVVSELEVTPKASGTSRQYQEKFVSGIEAEVVGKSLAEISVSKVSGSSLTSQGFNSALEDIKSEASG